MRVWIVRAGKDHVFEGHFLEQSLVGIDFKLAAAPAFDLANASREEIGRVLESIHPDQGGAITGWTGQCWAFAREMQIGDLVVTPLAQSGHIAVGRVTGALERSAQPPVAFARAVRWLERSMSKERLGEDLVNSLGSISTVSSSRASAAAGRIEAVLAGEADPGPDISPAEDAPEAWLFAFNPGRFDLLEHLNDESVEWSALRYRKHLRTGQRVWFRRTGDGAIVARGELLSAPYRADEAGEWRITTACTERIEPPFSRTEIEQEPAFAAAAPLRGQMGTIFAIDAALDERLDELIADRMQPLERHASARAADLLERATREHELLVRSELLAAIRDTTPDDFEALCRAFLEEIGLEEAVVTGAATAGTLGDGGVDVRGTMRVIGLPPIRVAVQAKQEKAAIQRDIVQKLRGALLVGEYGLLITSGRFSRGAIEDATAPGKMPIAVIDGERLADEMLRLRMGVREGRGGSTILRLDRAQLAEIIGAARSEE
jgi:predicted Mrr-cat superfamily restriction endonuclease